MTEFFQSKEDYKDEEDTMTKRNPCAEAIGMKIRYLISETVTYCIKKDFDLVESPAYYVIITKGRFDNPTRKRDEKPQLIIRFVSQRV